MADDNKRDLSDTDITDIDDTDDEDTDEVSITALLFGRSSGGKKSRVGGRVRALKESHTLIADAHKLWKEKQGEVAEAVVKVLDSLLEGMETLRNPPPKKPRDGSVSVKRPFYVGVKPNGHREAFRPALTAPDPVSFAQTKGFVKAYGPFSSKDTALNRVEDGIRQDDREIDLGS